MPTSSRYRNKVPMPFFDGGLNNKFEPTVINETESPDCANVTFDDKGSVGTREGAQKLNTAAVGSYACDGLFTTRFNDGSSTMVAWWNGSMFTLAGTTFTTVPSAQSVFTAGQKVDMVMYQDYAFFGNGGSDAYKYNGTEFTRHGIPQPNSTPAVATTSAGTLSGDLNYKVSYVNSASVEGDVSTFTATVNAAASSVIGLTSIPLAPASFGVGSRKIYRRDPADGIYKLVTTISDNTTTTYADDTPDSSLGAAAPSDQGEPPKWKGAVVHQERIWCFEQVTNPQYGWYSELANPFVVKTTSFDKIADGDGEIIRGVSVHANSTVWHKDNAMWLIYQQDTTPSNWIRVKSNIKYGSASHHAVVDFDKFQMFFAKRYTNPIGFMAMSGIELLPAKEDLKVGNLIGDAKSTRIEDDIFLLNKSKLEQIVGVEFENKLYFSVPYGTSQTTNNRIYVFDFVQRDKDRKFGSWVPWTGSTLAAADFTIYDGELYFGSSTANGFVYKLTGTGVYNDDGNAIDSYIWTKEFEGQKDHDDLWKDFRELWLLIELAGDYPMNVTWRCDSDTGSGNTTQIDLDPGGSLWGTMLWGIDSWGGGQTRARLQLPLGKCPGRRIQFKFDNQNTVNQRFKVIEGSFFYNRRGLR